MKYFNESRHGGIEEYLQTRMKEKEAEKKSKF